MKQYFKKGTNMTKNLLKLTGEPDCQCEKAKMVLAFKRENTLYARFIA